MVCGNLVWLYYLDGVFVPQRNFEFAYCAAIDQFCVAFWDEIFLGHTESENDNCSLCEEDTSLQILKCGSLLIHLDSMSKTGKKVYNPNHRTNKTFHNKWVRKYYYKTSGKSGKQSKILICINKNETIEI